MRHLQLGKGYTVPDATRCDAFFIPQAYAMNLALAAPWCPDLSASDSYAADAAQESSALSAHVCSRAVECFLQVCMHLLCLACMQ
jgi:hypothetical protein